MGPNIVAKTNVMVLIENIDGYVYLGHQYSLKENNYDK